jgi:Pentapeptide repeats (8 copies)
MMKAVYGHSREDVARWPDDPAVRRTLEEYFDRFPTGPRTVGSLLNGRGLDFTGADLSGLDLVEAALCEANLSWFADRGAPLVEVWRPA